MRGTGVTENCSRQVMLCRGLRLREVATVEHTKKRVANRVGHVIGQIK